MDSRREILHLARLLAATPTVSYREHLVMAHLRRELDRSEIPHACDRWGNLIARYRGRRPRGRTVAFVAHTDHPGLIVTASDGRRAIGRWLGGVEPRYFAGAKARVETPHGPVRGRVRKIDLGPTGRVVGVELDLRRSVPIGSIGGWDLTPFSLSGDRLRTKSADDLLGCAAILTLLKDLSSRRPPIEVWGVFTRAEEVGLFGACAVAEDRALPPGTAVVSIETSRELPCGRLGCGPIVRVGDRMSIFDPEVGHALKEAAQDVQATTPGFRWQRGLMDGGTCEATPFQAFGYATGAIALPLGNYHNMGKRGIAPEIVHRDDLVNLARLLPTAAAKVALARDPRIAVRGKFLAGLRAAKRELYATRSVLPALCIGAALALGCAGAFAAVARAADPSPSQESPPISKPALASPSGERRSFDTIDPRDDYDALAYDISIRIAPPPEPDSGTVRGIVEMQALAVTDLNSIDLDIGATLSPDSVWASLNRGPIVPTTFTRPEAERIRVALPGTASNGDHVLIGVRYSGTPGPMCFSASFYSKHGNDSVGRTPIISTFSEPDCSHQWWPCKDRFDDKATVTVAVDAPAGYTVAGNGTQVGEVTNGDRKVTTWATDYPITPYLVAIAATNFVVTQDAYQATDGNTIPLVVYSYPEDSSNARVHLETMKAALAAFEPDSVYGPYPFRNDVIGHEKLGLVEFPGQSVAMENQTIIFAGEPMFRNPTFYASALAHEVSHHWWGDALTCANIDDIWLNEGFASYSEALYAAAHDMVGYWQGYRRAMMWMRHPVANEYAGPIVHPTNSFGGTVYYKGSWVLHMLRGTLGSDLFFRCLHEYYDRYKYASATTDDFIRAVEETAGRDLNWFFIPWLYGIGRPQLAWDWEAAGPFAQGYRVSLRVTQTQPAIEYPNGAPVDAPPSAYSFPLEVRLYGSASDSLTRRIFVGGRDFAAVLDSIPFQPTRVALDPDQWILRELASPGTIAAGNTIQVWPNPSRTGFTMMLHTEGGAPTTVEVIAPSGRRVRSLPPLTQAGYQQVTWDGKSDDGRRATSGLYLVRISGPGGTRSTRVVLTK